MRGLVIFLPTVIVLIGVFMAGRWTGRRRDENEALERLGLTRNARKQLTSAKILLSDLLINRELDGQFTLLADKDKERVTSWLDDTTRKAIR